MSEPNFSQKDSPRDSSFSSINWISLWQASGNNWNWMVKQGCLSNPRSSLQKKESLSQRKIFFLEIVLTIALLLLARYIESSHQFLLNQSPKSKFFDSSLLQFEPNSKDDSFLKEKE